MTLGNAILKMWFAEIASNADTVITLPQIKDGFIWKKTTFCQSSRRCLCRRAHCSRWFCVRRILCKGTLVRSTWYSRRQQIFESDNDIPVPVLQCSVNCRDHAVLSVTVLRIRCPSCGVIIRLPLTDFRFVRFSYVHRSHTRITIVALSSGRSTIAR